MLILLIFNLGVLSGVAPIRIQEIFVRNLHICLIPFMRLFAVIFSSVLHLSSYSVFIPFIFYGLSR